MLYAALLVCALHAIIIFISVQRYKTYKQHILIAYLIFLFFAFMNLGYILESTSLIYPIGYLTLIKIMYYNLFVVTYNLLVDLYNFSILDSYYSLVDGFINMITPTEEPPLPQPEHISYLVTTSISGHKVYCSNKSLADKKYGEKVSYETPKPTERFFNYLEPMDLVSPIKAARNCGVNYHELSNIKIELANLRTSPNSIFTISSDRISYIFAFLSILVCYIAILVDSEAEKRNSDFYIWLLFSVFCSLFCFTSDNLF